MILKEQMHIKLKCLNYVKMLNRIIDNLNCRWKSKKHTNYLKIFQDSRYWCTWTTIGGEDEALFPLEKWSYNKVLPL